MLPDSDCGGETCRVAMRLRSRPSSSRSCSTSEVRGATLTVEMEGEETSMTLSASWARASRVISPEEAKTHGLGFAVERSCWDLARRRLRGVAASYVVVETAYGCRVPPR